MKRKVPIKGDLVRHKSSRRLATVLQIVHEWDLVAKLAWVDNGRRGKKYVDDLEIISRAPDDLGAMPTR